MIAGIALNALAMPFNHVPLSKNIPANAIAWLGNILLIQPYVGGPSLLLVSWSLVFEVGFYILVALGFWMFRAGVGLRWVVTVSVVLGFVGLFDVGRGLFYVLGFGRNLSVAGWFSWRCGREAAETGRFGCRCSHSLVLA